MEEYNFEPISYNDFYDNAEFIVRKFFKFDGIDEYYYARDNVGIYHAIKIDKNKYKTIEEITKYFDSKPTYKKDMDISDYIELKKKQETTT